MKFVDADNFEFVNEIINLNDLTLKTALSASDSQLTLSPVIRFFNWKNF